MPQQASDARLVDGLGLWAELLGRPTDYVGQPALFLDRDGVIIEDTHYLSDPADLRLIAGAAAAIRLANAQGIPVVVVTNQSGIARGYYDWPAFARVQNALAEQLASEGARLDMVLACGYHESASGELAHADHAWRKPNPGMLLHAAEVLGLDLTGSVILGDRLSDIEAGHRAGLRAGYLVRTGHRIDEAATATAQTLPGIAVDIAETILPAVSAAMAAGLLMRRSP